MSGETHFIQQGDGPVFIGPGPGVFVCGCGNTLIEGYDAARFLSVGLRCAHCGHLTTTPPLAADVAPPFAAIVAEPVAELRPVTTTLPAHVFVIGRAEMDRISALYQPATPPSNVYHLSPALLDQAIAAHGRHTGADPALGRATFEKILTADITAEDPHAGLKDHALAWAIRHLRARMRSGTWDCLDQPATANAVTHVAGFLHFVATWSHHPLFPAILAGAATRGFSLHGLAPFAAAHCATMLGNRISLPPPTGTPGRIDGFSLATGPTDIVRVHVETFDRFEFPFGQPWTQATLRSAVADRVAGVQAHINLRHPGLLVLPPAPRWAASTRR